jgi:hypothetical protein
MPENPDIIEIFAELGDANDRAAAIVAACVVEDSLSGELRTKTGLSIEQCEKRYGSFKDKIDGAHLLGIIKADERDDLDLIRRVRNKFAHHANVRRFSHKDIEKLCQRLHFKQAPTAICKEDNRYLYMERALRIAQF